MLLWIFALKLGMLPIVGGSISLENLILPMVTLGVVMTSKYTRQVRAAVLEELNQDYVMGARAGDFRNPISSGRKCFPMPCFLW